MSIPTQKNSEPYRLVIDRISNFSQNKKVPIPFTTAVFEYIALSGSHGMLCHHGAGAYWQDLPLSVLVAPQ